MNKSLLIIILLITSTTSYFAQSPNEECNCTVPEIVTMDCKDGDDYQLKINCSCELEKYSFSIFNRWGSKIFESEDINENWDASKIDDGAYFWVLNATFENDAVIEKNGTLTLVKG